jgi:hypothetical protein
MDRPLDSAGLVENPNLARAKARAASGVVNRLLFVQEHRLHADALVRLPAVSKWTDFDDCHDNLCVFLQTSLNVQANMIQARNDQSQSEPKTTGRFTGQRLKLLRPETYRRAVELLAEPREQVPYSHCVPASRLRRLLHRKPQSQYHVSGCKNFAYPIACGISAYNNLSNGSASESRSTPA